MSAEIKSARNWYFWLWFSPLLTIPTLVAVYFSEVGYTLVCRGPGRCDWDTAERVSLIVAILLSGLWHLVLLKPALEKDKPLLRWHGLQALSLAGLRTAVPLLFVILFGFDYGALLAIPSLILIWLTGNLIGRSQASHGKCSLAGWTGHNDEIAAYRGVKLDRADSPTGEAWVEIIRFSDDPEERRRALKLLNFWDMVEEF